MNQNPNHLEMTKISNCDEHNIIKYTAFNLMLKGISVIPRELDLFDTDRQTISYLRNYNNTTRYTTTGENINNTVAVCLTQLFNVFLNNNNFF